MTGVNGVESLGVRKFAGYPPLYVPETDFSAAATFDKAALDPEFDALALVLAHVRAFLAAVFRDDCALRANTVTLNTLEKGLRALIERGPRTTTDQTVGGVGVVLPSPTNNVGLFAFVGGLETLFYWSDGVQWHLLGTLTSAGFKAAVGGQDLSQPNGAGQVGTTNNSTVQAELDRLSADAWTVGDTKMTKNTSGQRGWAERDGKCVQASHYPLLAAAFDAGLLPTATESQWFAPDPNSRRAAFSSFIEDGVRWIRLPDDRTTNVALMRGLVFLYPPHLEPETLPVSKPQGEVGGGEGGSAPPTVTVRQDNGGVHQADTRDAPQRLLSVAYAQVTVGTPPYVLSLSRTGGSNELMHQNYAPTLEQSGDEAELTFESSAPAQSNVDKVAQYRLIVTDAGNATTVVDFSVTHQYTTATSGTDKRPNAFVFNRQDGVAENTVATSNEVIITGINTATDLSFTSIGGGEWTVNESNGGGVWTNAATGTIQPYDRLKLRHNVGANGSTRTSTVVVGGVGASFVTTASVDGSGGGGNLNPMFEIPPRTDTPRSTLITSVAFTVTNIPAGETRAIAITQNGFSEKYRINNGPFVSVPSTVSNGDAVQVQHVTSGVFDDVRRTTVTIGNTSRDFVTTNVARPEGNQ